MEFSEATLDDESFVLLLACVVFPIVFILMLFVPVWQHMLGVI